MLGSAQSISGPNMVLNTIVAESLRQFADRLEGAADFDAVLRPLVCDTLRAHRRIIFNGNNYADAWVEAAARCGLRNDRTTVDALPRYIDPKNVALFQTHRVLSPTELHSRYEIKLETYCKSLRIEALTMLEMVRRSILPAAVRYTRRLSQSALLKKQLNSGIDRAVEESRVLGIHGKETTPYLLAKIKDITGGDSLAANIQLVYNNAALAARTAAALNALD